MAGRLIYYKCMTPEFLISHVRGVETAGSSETELHIAQDAENDEIILRVELLPRYSLKDSDHITVVIYAASEGPAPINPPPPPQPRPRPPPPPRRRDPLAYVVSDGEKCVGIQVRDPEDYHTIGPYQGIAGRSGDILTDIQYIRGGVEPITSFPRRWPQLFEIILKPQAFWGSCSSAAEGGHSFSANFPYDLRLRNGLTLEVYRNLRTETYNLNMIEVFIYKDDK